jgi:Holliday junction DNA helicase RuvA
MIGYLEGTLLRKEADRILLLANQVGYEILIPAVIMETLATRRPGDSIALYIYYYQTERQPKPVLIGFNLEAEKEFFQYLISVEAIGPLKAARALTISVREIARAIESRDVKRLSQLKGVGDRTARKMIATLEGKVGKFALIRKAEEKEDSSTGADFEQQVLEVLVAQLGYRRPEAKKMITAALRRDPAISTPEELFEAVYRAEANS